MSKPKLPEGWKYTEKWGFEWERADPEEPLYSLVMSVDSLRDMLGHIGLTVVPSTVNTVDLLNHELSQLVQYRTDREAVGVPAILAGLAVWLCSLHHENGGTAEGLIDVVRETSEDMEKDSKRPELKFLRQVFPHDPERTKN